MGMDEPKYTLDGDTCSANDLIEKAMRSYGMSNADNIYTTGMAAKVLRDEGHKVGYALAESEAGDE